MALKDLINLDKKIKLAIIQLVSELCLKDKNLFNFSCRYSLVELTELVSKTSMQGIIVMISLFVNFNKN